MSRSRFSTTDIFGVFVEHEAGVGVKDVSLTRRISRGTFHQW